MHFYCSPYQGAYTYGDEYESGKIVYFFVLKLDGTVVTTEEENSEEINLSGWSNIGPAEEKLMTERKRKDAEQANKCTRPKTFHAMSCSSSTSISSLVNRLAVPCSISAIRLLNSA